VLHLEQESRELHSWHPEICEEQMDDDEHSTQFARVVQRVHWKGLDWKYFEAIHFLHTD
jgi:hypothetical protein